MLPASPTWSPFRLQVYFNGHYWLAKQLEKAGIDYLMMENAFTTMTDPQRAQQLHGKLDQWARAYFPIAAWFLNRYHWSFMQVEYATDVVFRRQDDFQPLYDNIVRSAVLDVKAPQVATFLGRKLTGNYQDELGNRFSTRIQGTCIRHHMGANSINLYDKFGLIARVECTSNDVSFFKHRREVEQRNGETVWKNAPLRKNIYRVRDYPEQSSHFLNLSEVIIQTMATRPEYHDFPIDMPSIYFFLSRLPARH